jgi:hypothetical protein
MKFVRSSSKVHPKLIRSSIEVDKKYVRSMQEDEIFKKLSRTSKEGCRKYAISLCIVLMKFIKRL